jgi:hypothetical protein
MTRDTLERFLWRLAFASLPLVAIGCGGDDTSTNDDMHAQADMHGSIDMSADGGITACGGCNCPADAGPCLGRRTDGLPSSALGGAGIGEFLASSAHLEAEAAVAFDRLARELTLLGAPDSLVQAAARAHRDELRHAHKMGALAVRYGARPKPVRSLGALPMRPLWAIAKENVTEGCVGETFAALVAIWQSEAAGDPEIRAAMRSIAHEEVTHAEFSHALHAWARTTLGADEVAQLDALFAASLATLSRRVTIDYAPEIVALGGLPPAHVARHMAGELAERFTA